MSSFRPHPRLRAARAFTLVELLVVVIIIGILIAVAAPSFLGQSVKAQDSAARQYAAIGYRSGKSIWVSDASGEGYPVLDASGGTLNQLQAIEPEITFSYDVSANNANQVAVTRLNEDAIVYASKSASGKVFCAEDIESNQGAFAPNILPGLYWSAGYGSDPCGAGAVWGSPTGANGEPNPGDLPSTGHYPLPEPEVAGVATAVPIEDAANPNALTVPADTSDGAAPGNEIVYEQSVNSSTTGSQIYEADSSGTGATLMVDNSAGPASDPTFTSDRKLILYVSGGNLWATQAVCPTAPLTRCASERVSVTGAVEAQPTVSPDGTKIAYVADSRLYVWTQGAGVTAVGSTSTLDAQPRFSPNSSQLAYVAYAGDGISHLRVVNADGTDDRELTSDDAYSETSPVWTSNSQIEFLRHDLQADSFSLASLPAAGGTVSDMWDFAPIGSFEPSSMTLSNGTSLVYGGTDINGNPGLYQTAETGGTPRAVITPGAGVTADAPSG